MKKKASQIINKFSGADFHLAELFKGGFISLFFKGLSIVAGYIFFFWLSRYFGAGEVGLFSECWTIIMIASVAGRMGIDTSIVRFIASENSIQRTGFLKNIYLKGLVLVIAFSILTAIILVIFSQQISELYFKTHIGNRLIFLLAIACVPLAIMSYNAEALRGFKKVVSYNLFQNGTLYFAIVAAVFVISGFHRGSVFPVESFAWGFSGLMIASFFLVLFIFRIKKAEPNPVFYSQYSTKKIVSVSFPMFLSNSLFLVITWTDILFLGAYKTHADVGVYNIAVKIASLNSVALFALNTIASPKFAEFYAKNDLAGLRKIVKQTSLINTIISLPVFILIVAFPGFLLGIFGEEFGQGIITLIILSVGQLINALCGSTMHILNMTGFERQGRNIMFIVTILNVLLNYFLVPEMGITGAAISTAISAVVWNVLAVIIIYQKLGFVTLPLNLKNKNGI